MADPRSQVLPTLTQTRDANGGDPNGNFASYGRDVAMGQLYLLANGRREFMGGIQSRNVRETNGGEFMGMAGNDYLEPRFRLRQWQGSVSRYVIRTRDLQQMARSLYSYAQDIDWRQLPFEFHYFFNYQAIDGTPIEQVSWNIMTIFITDYELSEPEPNGKQMENFSWIGKGYQRTQGIAGNSDSQLQNLGQLWFSQANPPRGTTIGTGTTGEGVREG